MSRPSGLGSLLLGYNKSCYDRRTHTRTHTYTHVHTHILITGPKGLQADEHTQTNTHTNNMLHTDTVVELNVSEYLHDSVITGHMTRPVPS